MIRCRSSHLVVLLALSCAMSGIMNNHVTAAPAATAPAASTKATILAPSPANYRALAQQMNGSLIRDDLDKWFPAAIDAERGGFHQNYADDWKRNAGDERSIV